MIIGFIFLMRRVDRAADAKNPADYNKETDQGAHVVETTLVDVIISIVSGFIPSMEKHLPPGMKNRWNPFMPKISPAMPPTLDDPFAPKPKDPVTQSGNKGKSAATTKKPIIVVKPPSQFDLNNPSTLLHKPYADVETFLDGELLKQGFQKLPLKKGSGVRYINGPTQGDAYFLEQGHPNMSDPLHQGPYLKMSIGAKTIRIPLQGNSYPTIR